MDGVFEEIKDRVSMPEVVKFYGFDVNRGGMMCCPFHDDRNPSMKIYEQNYYCFGCGESGDATGFVAKIYGLRQIDAAKKISYDFGLGLFDRDRAVPIKTEPSEYQKFRGWINSATTIVSAYFDKLNDWRERYRPKNENDKPNALFVESLQQMSYVEYLRDTLKFGSKEDQHDMYEHDKAVIEKIRQRLSKVKCFAPPPRRGSI